MLNTDKVLSEVCKKAGRFTDGRSLFGLPISVTDCKRRREAGQVFEWQKGGWKVAGQHLTSDNMALLRFGKYCYFAINGNESVFIQCAQDPFKFFSVTE